jgi:hypothetical protein
MTTLRLIFVQNQPIFEFIYGLSFFVMGLAIALQSRRSTRLELARSLACTCGANFFLQCRRPT